MFINQKKSGFTLVEMMTTLTIFAFVSVMATYTMISAVKSAKKIQANAYLYSESQSIMDQVAKSIEASAIDYETYYARNVGYNGVKDSGWETPNYGFYAQSFYNPGTGGDGSQGPYDEIAEEGYYGTLEVDGSVDYDSQDYDTGTHPFAGVDDFSMFVEYDDHVSSMNAFCESTGTTCANPYYGIQDEIILINSVGDIKTIFALTPGKVSGEYGIAKMKMLGTDTDNDGVTDSWACDPKYNCADEQDPLISDFRLISSDVVSVKEFYVQISPYEDPYRAFAEEGAQIQPQITLTITFTLSQNYAFGLLGDLPSITLQRTISTGVYSKVASYE